MLKCSSLAAIFLMLLFAGDAAAQVSPPGFRDCSDCPEMVALPGGTFTMGVPTGEEALEGVPVTMRGRSEPSLRVTIASGLAMSRSAVTVGEFAAFVAATGHAPEAGCWAVSNTGVTYEYLESPTLSWRNPGFPQKDDHPVVCVSWNDAQAYARWLTETTGKPYRLPNEAEWEFAARAGTTTSRYWGDSRAAACAYGNVADLTLAEALQLDRRPQFTFRCTDRYVYTAPVRSFRPNAFGLYDMLGNVWQWVEDCVNPDLHGQPANGAPRLTGDCANRSMRGGSWSHLPWYVRAGNRVQGTAADRYNFAGIRVMRDR